MPESSHQIVMSGKHDIVYESKDNDLKINLFEVIRNLEQRLLQVEKFLIQLRTKLEEETSKLVA